MDDRLLGIYLNDHLAGSNAGLSLARRCAAENRGNAVGETLRTLLPELEEDRATIIALLSALGQPVNPVKLAAGRLLEWAGRLKLNGRLLSYSPLSRVVELEALRMGVEGKMAMFQVLHRLQREDARLARFAFARFSERAARQKLQLEVLRLAAADVAFAGRHTLAVRGVAEPVPG